MRGEGRYVPTVCSGQTFKTIKHETIINNCMHIYMQQCD